MKRKKLVVLLSVALTVCVIAGVSVYAASSYGTSSDPLITLSYLNNKLTPSVLDKVQARIEGAAQELEGSINSALSKHGVITAATYELVTLSEGQSLIGYEGAELLHRGGAGGCIDGLLDVSTGEALESGAGLLENHLYMVSAQGGGALAGEGGLKLLVRGSYSIN